MSNHSISPPKKSDLQGLIFDIRKYTLHDGPGVRTTVFFKGCPLSCLWCCNPESQASRPELVWVAERCPGEALNLIGRWVTVGEVLAEVMRDALYFESSGGGLTLSGGEPLAQPDFAAELLRRYKHEEKGESTAVETCGHVAWPVFERIAAEVDLFLFDIKHMDPAAHRRLTGRDNRLILENARRLAQAGRALVIRLPLIAGINDPRENLEATADFARSLPGVTRIDLLPYHRLGEPKYRRLEREYALGKLPSLPEERVAQVRRILERRGLEVRIGG
jgi:pyruvate formate lyase activating enzyme